MKHSEEKALQHGVKFAERTGVVMAKVASLLSLIRKDAASESEKVKQAVASLREASLLEDSQLKQAAEKLSTNAGSLEVLYNVATVFKKQADDRKKSLQKQATTGLGSPASDNGSDLSSAREKRARAITGYRRGSDDAEPSGTFEMLQRLGLPFGNQV